MVDRRLELLRLGGKVLTVEDLDQKLATHLALVEQLEEVEAEGRAEAARVRRIE